MEYLISFLEGIITFISPCLLPMLPVYLSYFAGGEDNRKKTIVNALGFIAGFSVVFVILGAFASSIGIFLNQHISMVNIISGAVIIILGFNFMGLIRISFLNKSRKFNFNYNGKSFFVSMIFGVVFSIGWTPCVGAFLGSALLLASDSSSVLEGVFMLLAYSAGLGIPFFISALLINNLKSTFDFLKKHYDIVNMISGIFLVIVGIMMMTGTFGYLLALLS